MQKGTFYKTLTENLVSVGKLCEDGYTVVFDQNGYMIFQGKIEVKGDGVTGQDRDPLTGLYPITLTTVPPYEDSSSSGSNTGCDQGTSLGDNGDNN